MKQKQSDRLMRIMSLQCKSGNKERSRGMMDSIIREICRYPDVAKACTGAFDETGNLFVVKGAPDDGHHYPCVVCHIDQVHPNVDNFHLFVHDDWIYALDLDLKRQTGTGGDDKCGIFIAIEALTHLPCVKVAFFVDEEIGCKGSHACDLDWFSDVGFILQADRHIRNGHEIITKTNGVTSSSKAFAKALKQCAPDDGTAWTTGTGSSTDVGALAKRGVGVSCVNLAAGYIRQHSDSEVVSITSLERTRQLVLKACSTLTSKRWRHRAKSMWENAKKKGTSYHPSVRYGNGGYGGGYGDDYDHYYSRHTQQPKPCPSPIVGGDKFLKFEVRPPVMDVVLLPEDQAKFDNLSYYFRQVMTVLLYLGFTFRELEGIPLHILEDNIRIRFITNKKGEIANVGMRNIMETRKALNFLKRDRATPPYSKPAKSGGA